MADSYHIIDGKVVPYSGGRKCNDTYAWRDATPLELQLQEQLEESEHAIAAQAAEIEALRAEVERLSALLGQTEHSLADIANAQYLRAERLAEALGGLVGDIESLAAESDGVAGLHLNGDVAPWDELMPGGRFERLEHMDKAHAALEQEEGK